MNNVRVVKNKESHPKGWLFGLEGALPICKEKACNLTYPCVYVKIIQFSLHIFVYM